ncbi:PLP-dependent aminotransferase family protein [Pseudoxanthomonas putridarboris]|uniref:PLP-dependent aminotransferase family protein n=1 Tax=Pseudoxanthomonas putridarboris TaxID=752605 RepID=A0ABU9J3Y7_9GAMM
MHLNMDGHGPLHAQLTRALKAALFAGTVGDGGRLPATRQLARELGLSRNTVLAAYEQLRAEGFVAARVGSGSFVTPPVRPDAPAPTVRIERPAQSAFARRGRRYHDHANMAGRPTPGMRYAFSYGVPYTNPALTNAWARELSRAAAYTPPNYPMTQGLPALRQAVCDYLARRRGVQVVPEDVLIVAGTQQAMALTARVLLDVGDGAVVEEPHYSAMREVLQIHGARVDAVDVDAQGLRLDRLPDPPPRLIYVTPSHQFPSGVVMSLERRLALLDYARRHGCWIFEDDYDGEFRYDAQPLAALRSLDRDGHVVYVGTFSKVLFPSLRLGYLVMPPGLREDYVTAKWQDDFGSPGIEQAALANFIADGGFERHLRRTSRALEERRAALMASLWRELGDELELADSRAGMHLVAWLRRFDAVQGEQLIQRSRECGVDIYPITPYYSRPPHRTGLLMGFASMSVMEIEHAVQRLAECVHAVARG